jgi:hypothetical protein
MRPKGGEIDMDTSILRPVRGGEIIDADAEVNTHIEALDVVFLDLVDKTCADCRVTACAARDTDCPLDRLAATLAAALTGGG